MHKGGYRRLCRVEIFVLGQELYGEGAREAPSDVTSHFSVVRSASVESLPNSP